MTRNPDSSRIWEHEHENRINTASRFLRNLGTPTRMNRQTRSVHQNDSISQSRLTNKWENPEPYTARPLGHAQQTRKSLDPEILDPKTLDPEALDPQRPHQPVRPVAAGAPAADALDRAPRRATRSLSAAAWPTPVRQSTRQHPLRRSQAAPRPSPGPGTKPGVHH
jgi:hypothetical protein